YPDARRFDRLTFSQALAQRLQIMDSTAFSLCMDNKIPIVVFDMYKPGSLRDVVLGRKVGTLVCDETPPDVKIQTPCAETTFFLKPRCRWRKASITWCTSLLRCARAKLRPGVWKMSMFTLTDRA